MSRARIWRSRPPCLECCCLGSSGIFGVLGLRVGCLSAWGTSPFSGFFTVVALFPLLSLSEPEREDEESLLVADKDEDDVDDDDDDDYDEEAAGEPPCRFVLVAFLAALGEALV